MDSNSSSPIPPEDPPVTIRSAFVVKAHQKFGQNPFVRKVSDQILFTKLSDFLLRIQYWLGSVPNRQDLLSIYQPLWIDLVALRSCADQFDSIADAESSLVSATTRVLELIQKPSADLYTTTSLDVSTITEGVMAIKDIHASLPSDEISKASALFGAHLSGSGVSDLILNPSTKTAGRAVRFR